jgi:hypothetical protein
MGAALAPVAKADNNQSAQTGCKQMERIVEPPVVRRQTHLLFRD